MASPETQSELLEVLKKATDEELEKECKRKKEERGHRISEAVRIQDHPAGPVYVFVLDLSRDLFIPDDADAEVRIGTRKYKGTVLSVESNKVTVSFLEAPEEEKDLTKGRLFVSEVSLLEKLRDNLKSLSPVTERLPDDLFLRGAAALAEGAKPTEGLPNPGSGERKLNLSQARAVATALNSRYLLVWGPPGTGKTKTLAHLVAELVRRGKRVLVVSTANIAVDEAAEDTAEVLYDTEFYRKSIILRVGNVRKPELTRNYPLAVLDAVLQRKRGELQERLSEVFRREHDLKQAISRIEEVEELEGTITGKKKQLNQATSQLEKVKRQLSDANKRKFEKLRKLDELKARSQSGSFLLKRLLFFGCSPGKEESLKKKVEELEAEAQRLSLNKENLECQVSSISYELEAVARERARQVSKIEKVTGTYDRDLKKKIIDELRTLEKLKEELSKAEQNVDWKIKRELLGQALAVFTTLTKCYTDNWFVESEEHFDVCIVDEASMASLVPVYWAMTRAKQSGIFFGDFLQLPPVYEKDKDNKYPLAMEWFGKNIYNLLGITDPDAARNNRGVVLLDTQYRMNPGISRVINELFYGNLLRDGENTRSHNAGLRFCDHPLVLVDTSRLDPEPKRGERGSWANDKHEVVALNLIKTICKEKPELEPEIGVATPYALQARNIAKRLKDHGLAGVYVSTVHRFQGGEKKIIIFDPVGPEVGAGMGSSYLLAVTAEARNLLNVAVSRAKCQFYLILNSQKVELLYKKWLTREDFREKLPLFETFCRFTAMFKESGKIYNGCIFYSREGIE